MNACKNPFRIPPRPIPCDPYEWDGDEDHGEPWLDYKLFTPEIIETIIDRNHAWLQARPREAYDVLRVLFPRYQKAGMTNDDILAVICHGLWEAGYKPSGERLDARWTFPA